MERLIVTALLKAVPTVIIVTLSPAAQKATDAAWLWTKERLARSRRKHVRRKHVTAQ